MMNGPAHRSAKAFSRRRSKAADHLPESQSRQRAKQLLDYPWQWMLSGHTHGRQVGHQRVWAGQTALSAPASAITRTATTPSRAGILYVNRGLSYGLLSMAI
jgi:predicted MPP superfamily phosphohydrolase